MSAGRSPGVELVLALLRDAARDRTCGSCGASLTEAAVAPVSLEPERLIARLHCACGAAETVEVRPATAEGRAEIG